MCEYRIQCKRVHNLSAEEPQKNEGIFNYWALIFILDTDGHIYMEMIFASILPLALPTNKSHETLAALGAHRRCRKRHVLRWPLSAILIKGFIEVNHLVGRPWGKKNLSASSKLIVLLLIWFPSWGRQDNLLFV